MQGGLRGHQPARQVVERDPAEHALVRAADYARPAVLKSAASPGSGAGHFTESANT